MKTIVVKILALMLFVSLALGLTACGGDDIKYAEITVRDFGVITVELYADVAPVSVANFVDLANRGIYEGSTFHRILNNFMIQGGAPADGSVSLKPIKGEFTSNGHKNNIDHVRGVISMARSNEPNSATSQFFICNADSPHLNGDYAAFGRVISGMEVVDAITEHGMNYTSSALNGIIYDVSCRPVIESIVIYDELPEAQQ